jgi:hypothetical protein
LFNEAFVVVDRCAYEMSCQPCEVSVKRWLASSVVSNRVNALDGQFARKTAKSYCAQNFLLIVFRRGAKGMTQVKRDFTYPVRRRGQSAQANTR